MGNSNQSASARPPLSQPPLSQTPAPNHWRKLTWHITVFIELAQFTGYFSSATSISKFEGILEMVFFAT